MASLPGPHGTTLEIHEWMTWLRVRADLGVAMLMMGRHNGDLEGRPIGLFHASLRAPELAKLRDLVESTKWAQLPAPTGGDVTASMLSIEYVRGALLINREFNASSREFIAAIWPLMEALNAMMAAMLATPAGALVVSAAAGPDPGDAGQTVLQLTLSNPGTGPVVLTDPRTPAGNHPRAKLMSTPATNDPRPPTWTPIALPPLPAGQPELVTIPAGGRFDLRVHWQGPPGSYYLRGEWFDYGGPPEDGRSEGAPPGSADASGFAPVMPLTADPDEPAAAAGPYAVRGAAFSSGVPFVAGPPQPR